MSETAKRRAADRSGWAGERRAALLLRIKGYTIVATRWRCPAGEIDIVARRGRTLAFVEVKVRATRALALESLTPHQTRRLGRAASAFLAKGLAWRTGPASGAREGGLNAGGADDRQIRFDLIIMSRRGWPRHIQDAWRPDL